MQMSKGYNMNIAQSIKNLVKDEQKPLFKLAEILMCEVADSLKREFQKFNEESQKDFPLTIDDLNSKRYITVPKELTEYAKLYDLAGELMAACDQIYVNYNDFDAIKAEFPVTVGRTDMQPMPMSDSKPLRMLKTSSIDT